MLTPQEVQDKKFPKAVFGGYDMGEVDDFLDSVSEDYTALYKENVVLKNKLKILAEKVEEYRSVDAAMRKALLSAQKMANEITEEAKLKCEELRIKAQTDYENSVAALKDNIKNEEKRLEKLREETSKFAEASILVYNRQIENIRRMVTEPVVEKVDKVNQVVEDIERNFSRSFDEETRTVTKSPEITEESEDGVAERIAATAQLEINPSNEAVDESSPANASNEINTINVASSNPVTNENLKVDTGYNSYDLSELFPSEARQSTTNQRKDAQEPREVNVGGMNVRVFEMDLTDDKKEDAIL
ncbi:MAG: DivIVA domain-containing protein [Clostridiales bacterium]|nr:DivIVA domain-containing protein [Clostridiales bacterium]